MNANLVTVTLTKHDLYTILDALLVARSDEQVSDSDRAAYARVTTLLRQEVVAR